ncbi:YbfB/YjiJ family MFS transporter [Azospirillum soli]|uniref:YbfB/YjiJ family MFS transporter n=1 Tax=Azospirillum soli TaxID=1304799 RepID=UPI001AE71A6C|nr:YbfB/YjiJ family MFS transporter [Azospirillum soli]
MIRVLIGGVLALAIAMGVGRFAFTPILPAMQAATGLGADGAGFLASLNYLGYFVGALGAGLVPHGSVRTAVFRTALIASVTSTAGMGFTESMAVWGVLRFVSGLASAGMFILGIAMVLDALARAGREAWTGWLYTGVGIGIASSGLFVAIMGERLGWRGDWLWLGLICTGFGALSWLWVTDPPPAAHHATAAGNGAKAALSAPLVLLTLAYFLEGGGYIVTGTFLVAILKTMPETAKLGEAAWMVTGLAAMPSGLIWAAAGRKMGPWRALILGHLVQAVGIVLPMTGAPVASVISAALYGGTFIGIVTLSFTLGRQLSGGASARVIGALTAVYGLGQIIGPLPAGLVVANTGSFDSALIGAAAAVLAGAVLLAVGAWLTRPAPEVAVRT